MRSLVVYESWYGNTRRIAEKIASVLAEESEVKVVSVDDPIPPLHHLDLIVLGAPTHVHGLSSARSRDAALEQGARGWSPGIGARGWIGKLPLCGGPAFAVFDTRAHKPALLVGSAAHGMASRLRRRGYKLVTEPESFFVQGTPGPLEEGELERAEEWGKTLANAVTRPAVMI
ncbi:MAG TPA: flavodoxin domain-containing protein [Gaiellaceae bacterium]|jgi:flavodoxin